MGKSLQEHNDYYGPDEVAEYYLSVYYHGYEDVEEGERREG